MFIHVKTRTYYNNLRSEISKAGVSKMIQRGIHISFIIILSLLTKVPLKANNDYHVRKPDSLAGKREAEIYLPKTGYNLAPFPEFRVDPVVGIYFGLNASLFNYGDGDKYPDFDELINLNAAWGTKGKTNFSIRYKRFHDYTISGKLGYSVANLYPFYGFNGYQTIYNRGFEDPYSDDYITSAFYNYRQEKTQMDFYLQNEFRNTRFSWLAGFEVAYYGIDRVNFNQLNRKVTEEDIVEDTETLFDKYIEWNLIDGKEIYGGWANSVRAGILYDTRDRYTNPMKGVWIQTTVRYSPELFGNHKSGVQLGVKHHQFITLIRNRISFAYRLRYDATFGDLAFYHRQVLADGTEGYGGATGVVGEGFGTLWGIHQNRAVGKQMVLGNFELRAKLFRFRFFNQNIHTAIVPLFHTGTIIEPYNMNFSSISDEDLNKHFKTSYKGWYSSAGIGGKLIINENIVIGLDFAHSINSEAGNNAMYIGFGYTF
jgi:hypothetical protein